MESSKDEPSTTNPSTSNQPRKEWLTTVYVVLVVIGALLFGATIGMLVVGNSSDMCTSQSCLEAGRRLTASLNTSADPCENFSEYSCGGWISSHPIPDDLASLTTFDWLSDQTIQAMKTVFERQGIDSFKANSVRMVLDLYRECMNDTARNLRGLDPLRELLKEIMGSSEWPIVKKATLTKENLNAKVQKDSFLKTLARLGELNVSPLIAFKADKDANSTESKNIVAFSSPIFGLPQKSFANVNGSFDAEIDIYRQQNREFAGLIYQSSELHSENLKKLLDSRIEEILEFEKSLALATLPESSWRNPTAHYNKMTLEEFASQSENFFNYTAFLNELAELYKLPYRFNSTDQVAVKDVGYYRKLSEILVQTPSLTLYNYLGYKLAWTWAKHTDQVEREFRFNYRSQRTGVKVSPLQWKTCLIAVDGWATSRLFVDRFVQKPQTKDQASEMVNDLRKVFTEVLRQKVDWLDTATKNKALEKAAKIRQYVAYPDWLLNDTALDLNKYGFTKEDFVKVKSGHYFEGQLEMVKRMSAIPLRNLHEPLKTDNDLGFSLSPSTINARVTQEKNSLTITAALLQPPFFDPTLPSYLNYGAIGTVIGHELTHLFDDKGAQFDAGGNLVNWWSAATKSKFTQMTSCFVDQYESIVDQQTGVRLNGKRSLGENLSDNNGVRQAFLTMEGRLKREKVQKLPQMEHFTPKQLFFLSFAQVWCDQHRPKLKKTMLEQWTHMPGEYRINVPLSNLEQFSQAFNCPSGSRMNPVKKCRLW